MTKRKKLTAGRKNQLLLHISQQTLDTFDLEQILNILLDELKQLVDYDAAGIFILNRAVLPPRLQAPRQMIAKVVLRDIQLQEERSRMMRYGEGLVGYAIRTGECVVIPDVRKDPRYEMGRVSTRSEIVVPLFLGERAIGALNLESDHVAAFSKSDVNLLRFFADAAAITIDKAMLHLNLVEKKQLDDQLKTAQAIQEHLLPPDAPQVAGYDIANLYLPAFEIGGDYYDFFPLNDGQLGLVVADVSGDGVPSALVMAAFRALLRAFTPRVPDPAEMLEIINRMLPDFSGQSDFVSCFYGILDLNSGGLSYVNCGHNPPLHITVERTMQPLERSGPALGMFPAARFRTFQLDLAAGDLLVLYTDGLLEARDSQGRFFDDERLEPLLREQAGLPAGDLVQVVLDEARQFTGSQVFADDVTLVVIKRNRA